jgi:hypothetical protein
VRSSAKWQTPFEHYVFLPKPNAEVQQGPVSLKGKWRREPPLAFQKQAFQNPAFDSRKLPQVARFVAG